MNEDRTRDGGGTKLTQPRSGPVLYAVVDKKGVILPAGFTTASAAYQYANRLWPDQEQDETRSGFGWDIEVVGIAG